ncbi:hypothetical protein B0H14DRAFT_2616694 [Mycena olivaceomarginata]|nr:hypothetical protein B0H14DRAFT_2616694 [Mycena olivaceomarginata]
MPLLCDLTKLLTLAFYSASLVTDTTFIHMQCTFNPICEPKLEHSNHPDFISVYLTLTATANEHQCPSLKMHSSYLLFSSPGFQTNYLVHKRLLPARELDTLDMFTFPVQSGRGEWFGIDVNSEELVEGLVLLVAAFGLGTVSMFPVGLALSD